MPSLVWRTERANADTWNVFRFRVRVAEVWWIRALRFPHLTMQRVADGLNGDHGPEQPPRTWSIGTEGSPGQYPLLHNGQTVGEIVWHTVPTDPPKWHARMLAGLNYHAARPAADPNPEPLPADHRHLRAAS